MAQRFQRYDKPFCFERVRLQSRRKLPNLLLTRMNPTY